jgi:hypothetical protein
MNARKMGKVESKLIFPPLLRELSNLDFSLFWSLASYIDRAGLKINHG